MNEPSDEPSNKLTFTHPWGDAADFFFSVDLDASKGVRIGGSEGHFILEPGSTLVWRGSVKWRKEIPPGVTVVNPTMDNTYKGRSVEIRGSGGKDD